MLRRSWPVASRRARRRRGVGPIAPRRADKRRVDSYVHAAEAGKPFRDNLEPSSDNGTPRLKSRRKTFVATLATNLGDGALERARAADERASGGASSPVVTEWAKGARAAAFPKLQRQRQAQATERDTSKRVVLKCDSWAARQRQRYRPAQLETA